MPKSKKTPDQTSLNISLELKQGSVQHSFFYDQSDNPKLVYDGCNITIDNADASSNAEGWQDYKVYISKDQKEWEKTPTASYKNGIYSFQMPSGYKYASCYPTYSIGNLSEFIKKAQITNNKLGGQIPYFMFGCFKKPTIIIMARQYPCESMASFAVEGAIETLVKHNQEHANLSTRLLNHFSFIVFPMLNVSGVENFNHRYNTDEIDLNRDWEDEKSCEVRAVKKFLKQAAIKPYAFFDFHGDEVNKVIPTRQEKAYTIFNDSFFESDLTVIEKKPIPGSAREFFALKKFDSFTIELSAHVCTPEECKQIGSNLITKLIKTVNN